MSEPFSSIAEPERSPTVELVAGYLASLAIFASLISLAWHPIRLLAPALPAVPGIVLRADAGGHPRTRLGPRLRLDRVVDDRAEIDDGDLQDHHQEDDFPDRVRAHEVSLPGLDASNLWIWEYP